MNWSFFMRCSKEKRDEQRRLSYAIILTLFFLLDNVHRISEKWIRNNLRWTIEQKKGGCSMEVLRNLYRDQLTEAPKRASQVERTGYSKELGWIFVCQEFTQPRAIRTYRSLFGAKEKYTYLILIRITKSLLLYNFKYQYIISFWV